MSYAIFLGPTTFAAGSVTVTINQGADTAAVQKLETTVMTALDNLQAADTALAGAVTALATEQATFLTDIAKALAAAGTDPAALQAVADDINAQAAKLNDLAAAQVAADPATPAPAA